MTLQKYRTILGDRTFLLAYPGSPEQLYMGAGYVLHMTRKDKLKKGIVARTFHIPEELDEQLRLKAIKNKVRFSEITISALKEYLK